MTPLKIITSIRESDEYIKDIFLNGSCYQFHLFLKSLFPQSVSLISKEKNHVVTEIDGVLLDITGAVEDTGYTAMNEADIKLAEKWSFRKNYMLKVNECPACEEPIVYEREANP